MRTSRWALMLLLPLMAIVSGTGGAQGMPAMVVLVRHAEKATSGGSDPSLSEAGQTRARALATALADAHVTAIITTTFKRTTETAEPLATQHSITIEKIGLEGTTATHVKSIVDAINKHPGETVLVVGHSNTIPAIVTALGGPKLPDLCDAAYATLFVVHPAAKGSAPGVVRVKYGAADPDGAEGCTTPMR